MQELTSPTSRSTEPGAYVVLARKWRPAQFPDIVGQNAVVRTLVNALRSQRIHHAYLFTGSRGTGKTSTARIFAKVLRCTNARTVDENRLVSCDECTSCKEIAAGNGMDVLEIDGASNNGVEAVREIRENAKYMPSSGSRKIYIIDEVHMLTTAAFNALLKTLEEPPPHVLFVFATTEPHKLPETILSRCQRFDFKRVSVGQIQGRLEKVCAAESISAEPAALSLIARAAEGGMRDALSLLDQAVAFSGGSLAVQAVRESLGLMEGQALLQIVRSVFARKPIEALQKVDEAFQVGHDLRVLTRSLIVFLHAAILAKIHAPFSATGELSKEEWEEIQSIAELRSLEEIELFFQVLHHGLEWIARSPQPKLVLDLLLVKCATSDALIFADSSGTPSAAPSAATKATPAPQPTPVAQAAPPVQAAPSSQAPAPKPPAAGATSSSWEDFIDFVRKTRPLLASILEHGVCLSFPAGTQASFGVGYDPKDTYFRDQLQSRVYSEQLATLAKEYFGRPVRILVETQEHGESLAVRRERATREREQEVRLAAQNHPVILEAKSLFGGDLGPIELLNGENQHARP